MGYTFEYAIVLRKESYEKLKDLCAVNDMMDESNLSKVLGQFKKHEKDNYILLLNSIQLILSREKIYTIIRFVHSLGEKNDYKIIVIIIGLARSYEKLKAPEPIIDGNLNNPFNLRVENNNIKFDL